MAEKTYEVIHVLQDPDGVCAKITRRVNDGGVAQFSYQFFRQFEKNGVTHTTGWFSKRHVHALQRLTADIEERLELERERENARR